MIRHKPNQCILDESDLLASRFEEEPITKFGNPVGAMTTIALPYLFGSDFPVRVGQNFTSEPAGLAIDTMELPPKECLMRRRLRKARSKSERISNMLGHRRPPLPGSTSAIAIDSKDATRRCRSSPHQLAGFTVANLNASTAGKRRMKVAPCPNWLSTSTVPPCPLTIFLTI